MMSGQGIPVLILKEGTTRVRGREALRTNISVAKAVADAVRTTLGPKSMMKMLVDSFGDVVVTGDGATVMKEIEVEHPIAKMMVEVAKATDQEAGDGTTTSVILTGELLKAAEELIDLEIHPTLIVEAYRKAARKALETVDEQKIRIDWKDKEVLKKIAMVSMSTKAAYYAREYLADLAVEAILAVAEERDGKIVADLDNVKIEKKDGKSGYDSQLVRGVVIDKEVVHPEMPKKIENAKIALIQAPLEIEKLEYDSKINITSPEMMRKFKEKEKEILKNMVEKIKEVGANVVFCQKGIDDVAQHFLAQLGILAVRRVKKSDMEKLARATGASVVANIRDLKPEDLGEAELVEERIVGEDKMVFVEGCKNPRSVSILIRGGTKQIIDEAERTLKDALSVVRNAIEDQEIVVGGGAIETEIALALQEYAKTLGGKEQLVVNKFADAVMTIPKILIENSGFDVVTKSAELVKAHTEGSKYAGVDLETGEIVDMRERGILEPARVKRQVIKSASETAEAILKIDDVIAAGKAKEEKKGKEESGEFG
ncbi:MAG: thermosome subunit [Thermoproteota archaeon]|nr:MAG: thermosome subunit [Candidatus Korarchaeota archaeon]